MRGNSKTTAVTYILAVFLVLGVLAPICHSADSVEEGATGTPPGWSDDINLSNDVNRHSRTDFKLQNNEIHRVWEYVNLTTSQTAIFYSKSTDNGLTWNSRICLDTSLAYLGLPKIGLHGNNLHSVWFNNSGIDGVYYRNSTTNGDIWNPSKRITPTTTNSYGPGIFVNQSNVHIIWDDTRDGSEGEIYYRRSVDGGITFDNGQGVDEDRRITYSPSTIGSIRIAGDGTNISVIWNDERDGDFQIYWMISKDNGFTWEDGLGTPHVGRKISSSTNSCADHSLAMSGQNISIVWREQSWPGPYYTLYYRNSSDLGATWGDIQLITGPLPALYHPDVDTYENEIHIVWDEGYTDISPHYVKYINSTNGGISWNDNQTLRHEPINVTISPKIGILNNMIHVFWRKEFDSNKYDVYYKRYPDFPPDPTYNITLDQGWNLISTPLIQRDESIDTVLENITGKWDCIQYYDSINGSWLSNATFKPDQLNDLKLLNHKMAFWINITEPGGTVLTVSGLIPDTTTISLYAGWNLVGYPTLTTETVANALWGTGADKVEKFDSLAPYRISEVGPTYIMKPGEGYWIHVPADTIWIINW